MPRGEFDRSARKAKTRARLLNAAATVYARHGFNGATLEEVAAEAGLSKGAVYGHFGSKENLLLALLEEYLAGQISDQLALFDRDRATAQRPLAGSERWMEGLKENPDRFRLFIELWAYGQRDERLRKRLAAGLQQLRDTFASFVTESVSEAGEGLAPHAAEQFANVTVGLAMGFAILKLTDPDTLPSGLLGAVLSLLAQAPPETRELLAGIR